MTDPIRASIGRAFRFLSVTVALLAIVCVAEVEIVSRVPYLNDRRLACFLVTLGLGLGFLLVRRPESNGDPGTDAVLRLKSDRRTVAVSIPLAPASPSSAEKAETEKLRVASSLAMRPSAAGPTLEAEPLTTSKST